MTVQQATRQLQAHLAQLYDEREAANITSLVMENITGWKRIDRVLHKQQALLPVQLDVLKIYTDQLLQHRPVQYVLGETWFYGMKFFVQEQVLIPRPETEELIEWVIRDIREAKKKPEATIIDIGTGSGCIAVALKKELPGTHVYACDVSEGALEVAGKNAGLNGVQINFLQTDFLQPEQRNNLPVADVLISNPPYIPLGDKAAMQPHVLQYEPHLALFVADSDPLIFYKEMTSFVKTHLRQTGTLYVEVHEEMAGAVTALFRSAGFNRVEIKKDLQGKDRMIKADHD